MTSANPRKRITPGVPIPEAARLMRERYGDRAAQIARARESATESPGRSRFWGHVTEELLKHTPTTTAVEKEHSPEYIEGNRAFWQLIPESQNPYTGEKGREWLEGRREALFDGQLNNPADEAEAKWYGNATPTELTAAANWLRSEGRSIPAIKRMVKLDLIALEPEPHLTERGDYVVNRLPNGFIEQKLCGKTKERVSIYDAYEAGMVDEPDIVDGQDYAKYAIVCEEHGTLVTGPTLKWTRYHAVVPDWCPVCSGEYEDNPSTKKLKARLLR